MTTGALVAFNATITGLTLALTAFQVSIAAPSVNVAVTGVSSGVSLGMLIWSIQMYISEKQATQ